MRLLRALEGKYAAYAAWGPENRTTQGWFGTSRAIAFIIGDKASVNAEIARYREPSNAAVDLVCAGFAHDKPGRAPRSGGYDDTVKLAHPTARVLDPHRLLPYSVSSLALLCEQGAEAALILDRYGARTKTSAEADARTLKRLIYATSGRNKR
jgi:hypothetical protein